MTTLRSRLTRLAHEKPHLREHLLPLLKEGARGWDPKKAVRFLKNHTIPGLRHVLTSAPGERERIPNADKKVVQRYLVNGLAVRKDLEDNLSNIDKATLNSIDVRVRRLMTGLVIYRDLHTAIELMGEYQKALEFIGRNLPHHSGGTLGK